MANGEWLDYLAHNAPDELSAWFDAERITNQAEMLHMPESRESATMQQIEQVIEGTVKRGVYGDTEPEDEDSRDKLEADVRKIADAYNMDTQRHGSERFAHELYYSIIHLLNRQRAIDDSICDECSSDFYKLQEAYDALEDEVDKLTAERDQLKNAINELQKKQPYCYNPEQPLDSLNAIGRYIDEQKSQIRNLVKDLVRVSDERDNFEVNNQQLHTLAGEQAATIDELQKQVDELTNAGRKMSTELANMQDYITKVRAGRERYRSMCSEMATKIHDALMVMDEGMA